MDDTQVGFLYGLLGTRATSDSNWVWQEAVQTEGSAVAEVTLYQRASTAPTSAPSGVTWDFTTNAFTVNTLNGKGWYADIPAGTDPVYMIKGVTSGSRFSGEADIDWSAPVRAYQDGEQGSDGLSSYMATVYALGEDGDSNLPTAPSSGHFSFDFNDGELIKNTTVATWSTTMPTLANNLQLIYSCNNLVTSTTPTATVSIVDAWSDVIVQARSGIDGSAVEIVFKRSASSPALPAQNSSTVPNGAGGWYNNVGSLPSNPAGDLPIWSSTGTKVNSTSNWTWQTPVQQEGQAVVEVTKYRRSSSVLTAKPNASTWNFSSNTYGTFGGPTSWSDSVPAGTDPVYMVKGVASGTPESTAAPITWGPVAKAFEDGQKGDTGDSVSIQSSSTSNGVTTVVLAQDDGTTETITINDGNNGQDAGVLIIYADNAAGSGRSLSSSGKDYVLYYEYQGAPPSNLNSVTGTWVKFTGDTGGVLAVYSSVITPTANSQLSLTPSTTFKYVTFLEYTGVAPAKSAAIGQTFVLFIGSDGQPGGPGATGPSGAYAGIIVLRDGTSAPTNARITAIGLVPSEVATGTYAYCYATSGNDMQAYKKINSVSWGAVDAIHTNAIAANAVKAEQLEISGTDPGPSSSDRSRIFMDGGSNRIDIYDSNNKLRVRLGKLS